MSSDHLVPPDEAEVGPDVAGDQVGPSRRSVLRWLAYGTAGVAVAGGAAWGVRRVAAASSSGAVATKPVPPTQPVLVVVELGGGNDGWSTLAPFGHGRYHDLRPTLALGADRVIDQGDGWGLNARLAGLADRGLAVVQGVGVMQPDLSHFEMFDRWHHGNPDPSASASTPAPGTGFLGRLCDVVGAPGALTGLSLGWGDHPQMRTQRVATAGLGDLSTNPFTDEEAAAWLRTVLADLTAGEAPAHLDAARSSLRGVLELSQLVSALPPAVDTYPDTDLGLQMAIASRLVMSGRGIRVVHVPMGAAAFDTHARHAESHDTLMQQLDGALSAFIDDMRQRGVEDRVLVATTSEFGRRPAEHSGGLDHGAASVMMLLGPVNAGLHGEPSPIDAFDEFDNLRATVEFDRYYATLATWFGVDPAQVLASRGGAGVPVPIPGVVRT